MGARTRNRSGTTGGRTMDDTLILVVEDDADINEVVCERL